MIRKNVLVFLTDALTFSALGCYGNRKVRTPNIDRLAECGVRFSNATAVCPYCVPSRATLVTGLYPNHHGIVHNGCKMDYHYASEENYEELSITDSDVTADRILAEAGYNTCFLGRFHLTDEYGRPSYYNKLYGEMGEYLDRLNAYMDSHSFPTGTEIMKWYDWRLPTEPLPVIRASSSRMPGVERRGAEVYEEFIHKMGRLMLPHDMCFDLIVADLTEKEIRKSDGNFAITCSFGGPHDPWAVPEPYYSMYDPVEIELPQDFNDPDPAIRFMQSRLWAELIGKDGVREFIRIYYAQLSLIDEQVGRLLKVLENTEQLENTLIVFTADHGDMLGSRNMIEKAGPGHLFPEPLVHIPLIMSCPGEIPEGLVIDTPVSQVDVMPSILDYAGFPVPDELDGKSMRPLIETCSQAGWRPFAFSQMSDLARPFDRYSGVIRRRSMIRTREYKCVYNDDRPEILFYTPGDPFEQKNVLHEVNSSVLEELKEYFWKVWS